MANTFAHSSVRNMQVLTHQYLKETSVKYNIALTKLSLFMFSNVLPRDVAKDVVKFCISSQIFLKNFQNKDGSGAFFSKAWSLSFERFSQKIREFVKNLLLNSNLAQAVYGFDVPLAAFTSRGLSSSSLISLFFTLGNCEVKNLFVIMDI